MGKQAFSHIAGESINWYKLSKITPESTLAMSIKIKDVNILRPNNSTSRYITPKNLLHIYAKRQAQECLLHHYLLRQKIGNNLNAHR